MLKRNQGITLIALVVTIIILLILAGVTLSFVAGENGILKRATEAVDINEKATAEEEANLLLAELAIQYYEQKYVEHKEVEETLDAYLEKQLETGKSTGTGEYTVKIENGQVIVSKGDKEISKGTLSDGSVLEWSGSSDKPNKPNIENEDWKKILDLAGVDASRFNTYEEALEEETVRNAIIANGEAVDCLLNSSDNIKNTTINNDKMLENLATNEDTAKKIISDEKWYAKVEDKTKFFENININGTEPLNFVEDENPYYTFKAKANKTYFIQCYGAQGGSYVNPGGYGGLSYGKFKTTKETDLYIYKGGQGIGGIQNNPIAGGYNGGGAVLLSWSDGNEKRSSGGGATHVALVPRSIVNFRK